MGTGGSTAQVGTLTRGGAALAAGGSTMTIDIGSVGGGATNAGGVNGTNASGGRMVQQECASTSATATDVRTVQPADIVFAIDGSSSMAEETQFVQQQMNQFSQRIISSGIDVHVIVIAAQATGTGGGSGVGGSAATGGRNGGATVRPTTGICIGAPLGSGQCPADTNLPNYAHVPQAVASNDALNLFVSTYPQWKGYLRADASKSLVVVTDDNATATPNNSAATFVSNFTALDPTLFAKWTFSGVFCFTQCAQAAAIGSVYSDLVARTVGVSGDLCLQDFAPVFNRLAEQIILTSGSKLACEWELPAQTDGKTFSPSLVKVTRIDSLGTSTLNRVASAAQCGTKGGWYFDSNLNPTKILACSSSCDEMQRSTAGKVEVVFGCESVGSCVASESTSLTTSSCEWALPTPPSGQNLVADSVNVRYTSGSGFATDLGKVSSKADCTNAEEGWYYDDPNKPRSVIACPQTCAQIQSGGERSKLEVLFGCATAEAPPIVIL